MNDDTDDEVLDGIEIQSLKRKRTSRLDRWLIAPFLIFKKTLKIKADVYHFHDPEFIPYGFLLKLLGKKVIMDAHENYSTQIKARNYINNWQKKFFINLILIFESIFIKHFNYVCCATPNIREHFSKYNNNCEEILNYPLLEELSSKPQNKQRKNFIYIGGVTQERGIRQMISAFENIDAKLHIIGPFVDEGFFEEISQSSIWKNSVIYHGLLPRKQSLDLLNQALGGFILFEPNEHHINSVPNKLFEYMSAGVAVIASNFPYWQNVISSSMVGYCVDPLSEEEISDAINKLLLNENNTAKFSSNGIKAVQEKYNWLIEEKKLLKVYEHILSD